MSKINDINAISYPCVLSIRGKVFNHKDTYDFFMPFMKHMAPYANKTLHLMLVLRGKKYTLDGVHHSEEDAQKQIESLHKAHKCDMSLESFKQMCQSIYGSYSSYIDKKGNLKVNGKARGYANVIFNPSGVKSPCPCKKPKGQDGEKTKEQCKCKTAEAFSYFRKVGIFPILENGEAILQSLKFSVAQDVLTRLTSMEEISKEYEDKKAKWESALVDALEQLPKIKEYGKMLSAIRNIEEMSGFDNDNYKRFLNRWRDSAGNKNYPPRRGMRLFFMDKLLSDINYRFQELDRHLFGYCPELMNLIYHQYRFLWETEDIIGSQRPNLKKKDYVDVVIDNFSFQKEAVNISSFGKNGKLCGIHFGDNFVPFELSKGDDGTWSLDIKLTDKDGNALTHKMILCRSPHFSKESELSFVKKNEKAKKESIEFKYAADSKKKTWYTAITSEPFLRYDVSKKAFYICFPMSEHKSMNTILDVPEKEIRGYKNYLRTTAQSDNRQSSIINLPNSFRAMGVDLGLRNTFVASIYDVTNDGTKLSHSFVKTIRSRINTDAEKKQKSVDLVLGKVLATKHLIGLTIDYVNGKVDEIPNTYTNNHNRIDFRSILGINMDEYRSHMAPYKGKGRDALLSIRKDRQWIVRPIISSIGENVSDIRSEFHRTPKSDKKEYCETKNRIDMSFFSKKKMVKDYISLLRCFSTFGMTSVESKYIRKNFAKGLSNWYKGLVRKGNSIASDIINAARADNVGFIFIEDLDSHPSIFDSKEENVLKSLWGWGEITKWLLHLANKHNIVIVGVDPHLTSRVYYKNGMLGFEKGRSIVVDGIEIDRDINASHNILLRGLARHNDLREFYVEQISENQYRLLSSVSDDGGKRKLASAFHWLGSTKCIFTRTDNGILIPSEINKADEKVSKINEKPIYIIRHGDTWRLRHELDAELEAKKNGIFVEMRELQAAI